MTPQKKRLYLSPPHLTGDELKYVKDAFISNYIAPIGPMVDAFEREFSDMIGGGYALALSSGTAAIHLALRNLEVGPGDEVFASTLTFIGSVSPIVFQGASPVLIDSDKTSWNMDPELLSAELQLCQKKGKLPKAVIPTDLYGQCADAEKINSVCERFKVPVIFDASESLGAACYGKNAGMFGDASVFSFNGNKIITTSGGGMLVSHAPEFIERARFLSQQAREPKPHYEHVEIGYNYRMSNILAAIGRGQLRSLQERIRRKREIFSYYRQALESVPGIEFMPEASYGKSNRWLTVILIDIDAFGASPDQVRTELEAENIESRPVWKPMHCQPVFGGNEGMISRNTSKKSGVYEREPFSSTSKRIPIRVVGGHVAEDLFHRGLCLPSGTAMTENDLERVVRTIKKSRKFSSKRALRIINHRESIA